MPKFKFKSKGGKSEIIRTSAHVKDIGQLKRYCTAWLHFIKHAREMQADIIILNVTQVACNNARPLGAPSPPNKDALAG